MAVSRPLRRLARAIAPTDRVVRAQRGCTGSVAAKSSRAPHTLPAQRRPSTPPPAVFCGLFSGRAGSQGRRGELSGSPVTRDLRPHDATAPAASRGRCCVCWWRVPAADKGCSGTGTRSKISTNGPPGPSCERTTSTYTERSRRRLARRFRRHSTLRSSVEAKSVTETNLLTTGRSVRSTGAVVSCWGRVPAQTSSPGRGKGERGHAPPIIPDGDAQGVVT